MQQPDSPSTPAVLLERQWAERQMAIERAAEALRLKAEESDSDGDDFEYDCEQEAGWREAIDAQSMEMLLSRWGSARIAGIGRTRVSGSTSARIDIAATPSATTWSWTVQTRWYPGLSDHACLVARADPAGPTAGRCCTPTAIATLPRAALTDL